MPGLYLGLDCAFATIPDGLLVSIQYTHPCSQEEVESSTFGFSF